MHMCDYCCWYNDRNCSCECPMRMKKRMCEKAIREKELKEKKNGNRTSIKHKADAAFAGTWIEYK